MKGEAQAKARGSTPRSAAKCRSPFGPVSGEPEISPELLRATSGEAYSPREPGACIYPCGQGTCRVPRRPSTFTRHGDLTCASDRHCGHFPRRARGGSQADSTVVCHCESSSPLNMGLAARSIILRATLTV
jgi:hypothetical protein